MGSPFCQGTPGQDELAAGTLVEIMLDEEPEDLVLYGFYSGRKYPLEKVKAFLQHLEQALCEQGITGTAGYSKTS